MPISRGTTAAPRTWVTDEVVGVGFHGRIRPDARSMIGSPETWIPGSTP